LGGVDECKVFLDEGLDGGGSVLRVDVMASMRLSVEDGWAGSSRGWGLGLFGKSDLKRRKRGGWCSVHHGELSFLRRFAESRARSVFDDGRARFNAIH
jgi:hypothetical protein